MFRVSPTEDDPYSDPDVYLFLQGANVYNLTQAYVKCYNFGLDNCVLSKQEVMANDEITVGVKCTTPGGCTYDISV